MGFELKSFGGDGDLGLPKKLLFGFDACGEIACRGAARGDAAWGSDGGISHSTVSMKVRGAAGGCGIVWGSGRFGSPCCWDCKLGLRFCFACVGVSPEYLSLTEIELLVPSRHKPAPRYT